MTEVYIASNLPTNYPRKLQKPSTVNDAVRDSASSFIFDSGIGDDVSNDEVLDLAHDYDADYVIAKDYLHNIPRTTESVREFFELYDDHPCTATPMVPLQPPHSDHYHDLQGHSHYVLGGMATEDTDADDAIRWIRDAAQVIPDDAHIHALGVGGGKQIASTLAGTGVVDSIDCSTPELAASYGCILDAQLRQREIRIHSGEGARQRNVPLASINSWQIQDYWRAKASRPTTSTQLEIGQL